MKKISNKKNMLFLVTGSLLLIYISIKLISIFTYATDNNTDIELISKGYAILDEPNVIKPPADITSLEFKEFNKVTELPLTRDALWFRIHIRNNSQHHQVWEINTNLYMVEQALAFSYMEQGVKRLLEIKRVSGEFTTPRGLSIPVRLDAQQDEIVYLGVLSPHSSHFHFKLQNQRDHLNSHWTFINATVAICTLLILLCFINLFFYRALLHNYHFFYVLQQLVIVFLVLHSAGAILFNSEQFNFLLQLALMIGLLFTTQFLSAKESHPKLAKWVNALIIFIGGGALLQLLIPSLNDALTTIRPIQFALVIAIPSALAYQKMRQGYAYARSMFVGGLLFGSLLQVYILITHNIIEVTIVPHYTFLYLAIVLEALCLFIAISQKLSEERLRQQFYLESLNSAYSEQLVNTQKLQQQANLLVTFNNERTQTQSKNAALTHDIHHHLFLLRLSCDHIQAQGGDNTYLHAMTNSLDYLNSLTQELTQTQVNKLQSSDIEQLNINEMMQSLFVTFKPKAQCKHLQLKVRTPQNLVLCTSHILLRRILENLLSNAIAYTHKGKILLAVRKGADNIKLSVFDTGEGMERTTQARLMHRLERGNTKTEGYGLGLYIVNELCKQAGYDLSFKSQSGKGSVFTVCIPIRKHDDSE